MFLTLAHSTIRDPTPPKSGDNNKSEESEDGDNKSEKDRKEQNIEDAIIDERREDEHAWQRLLFMVESDDDEINRG